jgi:short-subunit dehydrogenase
VELGRESGSEKRQGDASRTTSADSELHKGNSLISVAKASYDANVLSCMNTIKVFLPLLQQSSRPRIAVLSSVAAEIPAPTRSIYAAHKAALSMFLRCLRIELDSLPVGKASEVHSRGVGISIIHPASISTGLREKSLDAQESASGTVSEHAVVQQYEKSAMSPEYVAEQVKRAIDCEIDEVWLPGLYWWVAKVGMVIAPGFIARKAKEKYKWSA